MQDVTVEVISGGVALIGAFFYTKYQTAQNLKEIEEIKSKLNENEKTDAIRETKIAVLENDIKILVEKSK